MQPSQLSTIVGWFRPIPTLSSFAGCAGGLRQDNRLPYRNRTPSVCGCLAKQAVHRENDQVLGCVHEGSKWARKSFLILGIIWPGGSTTGSLRWPRTNGPATPTDRCRAPGTVKFGMPRVAAGPGSDRAGRPHLSRHGLREPLSGRAGRMPELGAQDADGRTPASDAPQPNSSSDASGRT